MCFMIYRIGDYLLQHPLATAATIARALDLPASTVRWNLNKLARQGHVVKIAYARPGPRTEYRWVPRQTLRERIQNAQKKNTNWDRIWRAIRIKTTFTRNDIARLTGVPTKTVSTFLWLLKREGYVAWRGSYWILVKDPGPQRPRVGPMNRKGREANGKRKSVLQAER